MIRMNLTRKLTLILGLVIGCTASGTLDQAGGWKKARDDVVALLDDQVLNYMNFRKALEKIDEPAMTAQPGPEYESDSAWLSQQRKSPKKIDKRIECKDICEAIAFGLAKLCQLHSAPSETQTGPNYSKTFEDALTLENVETRRKTMEKYYKESLENLLTHLQPLKLTRRTALVKSKYTTNGGKELNKDDQVTMDKRDGQVYIKTAPGVKELVSEQDWTKHFKALPVTEILFTESHLNDQLETQEIKDLEDACDKIYKLTKEVADIADSFNKTFAHRGRSSVKVAQTEYVEKVTKWRDQYKKDKIEVRQEKGFANLMDMLKRYQADPSEYTVDKSGKITKNNFKKGYLHQICTQIGELTPNSKLETRYNIRTVHKKGKRIITKGVQKYNMNMKKLLDGFGVEIITKDYDDHVNVLENIFEKYGQKTPTKINVNVGEGDNAVTQEWKVQVLFAKFGYSCPEQTDEITYEYRDDKVIFQAEAPDGNCILLEAIIILKAIKDLKKQSHGVYDIVREAGPLVTDVLSRVGARAIERIQDKNLHSPASRSPRSKSQSPGTHDHELPRQGSLESVKPRTNSVPPIARSSSSFKAFEEHMKTHETADPALKALLHKTKELEEKNKKKGVENNMRENCNRLRKRGANNAKLKCWITFRFGGKNKVTKEIEVAAPEEAAEAARGRSRKKKTLGPKNSNGYLGIRIEKTRARAISPPRNRGGLSQISEHGTPSGPQEDDQLAFHREHRAGLAGISRASGLDLNAATFNSRKSCSRRSRNRSSREINASASMQTRK